MTGVFAEFKRAMILGEADPEDVMLGAPKEARRLRASSRRRLGPIGGASPARIGAIRR
jgi:hypothetical protein